MILNRFAVHKCTREIIINERKSRKKKKKMYNVSKEKGRLGYPSGGRSGGKNINLF